MTADEHREILEQELASDPQVFALEVGTTISWAEKMTAIAILLLFAAVLVISGLVYQVHKDVGHVRETQLINSNNGLQNRIVACQGLIDNGIRSLPQPCSAVTPELDFQQGK